MKVKKKLHRLLSILLCCALVLGLMPITAFAADPSTAPHLAAAAVPKQTRICSPAKKISLHCRNILTVWMIMLVPSWIKWTIAVLAAITGITSN
ncbi:MAG: hypothetical protein ACLR23_25220 [Clostridia bacterium]